MRQVTHALGTSKMKGKGREEEKGNREKQMKEGQPGNREHKRVEHKGDRRQREVAGETRRRERLEVEKARERERKWRRPGRQGKECNHGLGML